MTKYIYIGTEEQLIENGFKITKNHSFWGNRAYKTTGDNFTAYHDINIDFDNGNEITSQLRFGLISDRMIDPREDIKHLIDKNLVKVVERK